MCQNKLWASHIQPSQSMFRNHQDRQTMETNDPINQQIDKWMEGWVDRWKAQGENDEYLHS